MAWMGFKGYVFLIRGIYMHVLTIEQNIFKSKTKNLIEVLCFYTTIDI